MTTMMIRVRPRYSSRPVGVTPKVNWFGLLGTCDSAPTNLQLLILQNKQMKHPNIKEDWTLCHGGNLDNVLMRWFKWCPGSHSLLDLLCFMPDFPVFVLWTNSPVLIPPPLNPFCSALPRLPDPATGHWLILLSPDWEFCRQATPLYWGSRFVVDWFVNPRTGLFA